MIQYKRLAFRRQTFIEHCYIYISGLYAAVDFSYHMKYSGTGAMLHLKLHSTPQMLLDATQIRIQRCARCLQFQTLQNIQGDIGDIKRLFINLSLHCLRKKDTVKTTHF